MYFGENDDILTKEDWFELMTIPENDECLPCDLVFLQLASNFLNRNIILLPFYQNKKVTEEKKFVTILSNHPDGKKPFYMAYFPQGQFGPISHFQSIIDPKMNAKFKVPPTYVAETLDVLEHTAKQNATEVDDDDVDEDVDNLFSTNDGTERKEKYNGFNLVTMVTEKNPAESIIVNDTKKKITKKLRRRDTKVYEIAPGENKVSYIQFKFFFEI